MVCIPAAATSGAITTILLFLLHFSLNPLYE